MKTLTNRIALTLLASALVTGCGSGGGGGAAAPAGPVASTLTFPLQSAYKTYTANGETRNFTVSGSCSGSGSLTSAPATTPATFEGVPALSAATTITMSLSAPCAPSGAATSTDYYDSNYTPLGSVGVDYGVYSALNIPLSVTVGGTAIVGTENLYSNSTKTVGAGRQDISYVIEADTSTTAIVNLISKYYDAAGILTATEQGRYRITSVGALVRVSGDIQYASGQHLIMTFN
ncbi:MAG: hypothetical protein FD134_366 [Gallionellaceae bacterium]|nr:MAG: hypothetical protein FD134_366 [Gallionellaceae bacterium]